MWDYSRFLAISRKILYDPRVTAAIMEFLFAGISAVRGDLRPCVTQISRSISRGGIVLIHKTLQSLGDIDQDYIVYMPMHEYRLDDQRRRGHSATPYKFQVPRRRSTLNCALLIYIIPYIWFRAFTKSDVFIITFGNTVEDKLVKEKLKVSFCLETKEMQTHISYVTSNSSKF